MADITTVPILSTAIVLFCDLQMLEFEQFFYFRRNYAEKVIVCQVSFHRVLDSISSSMAARLTEKLDLHWIIILRGTDRRTGCVEHLYAIDISSIEQTL